MGCYVYEEDTAKKCVLGRCDFMHDQRGALGEPRAYARTLARVEHVLVGCPISGPGCEHSLMKRKSTGRTMCGAHALCTPLIHNAWAVTVFPRACRHSPQSQGIMSISQESLEGT